MGSTTKLTLILPAALIATAAAGSTSAVAADLLPPPIIEVPEVITEPRGGWYLRGDITYDFSSIDQPRYYVNGPNGTPTELRFQSYDLEDSFDIGVGIGYNINEYLRADLTGEYVFEADFNGSTCGGVVVCSDTSSVSKFKVLANAYVNMGQFGGFSPYVGAGLGGTYVMWNDLTNVNNNPPAVGGGTFTHPGEDSWRFTWALHAGVSYEFTHNMAVDLGYSYNRIEGGDFFRVATAFTGNQGVQGYDEGFEDHVFRAGIRYSW